MSAGFSASQIRWAQQHDWCLTATTSHIVTRGDVGEGKTMTWTRWHELVLWAGY